MQKTLASEIATTLQAMLNCESRDMKEAYSNHHANLQKICQNLPHGAGIDSTEPEYLHGLDVEKSTFDKLIINCSFHHMNDGGFYDGWTEHKIVVTPTFTGIDVIVTGRDRNDIKEYLAEAYHTILSQPFKV